MKDIRYKKSYLRYYYSSARHLIKTVTRDI